MEAEDANSKSLVSSRSLTASPERQPQVGPSKDRKQFTPPLTVTPYTMAGFVNRDNRVPYYQRLFQDGAKQHVRQWNQTAKSKILLRPYYVLLWGGFGASMYMMGRMVLGHKTWYAKN